MRLWVRELVNGTILEGIVGEEKDFKLDPWSREPKKVLEDRGDVGKGKETGSRVLNVSGLWMMNHMERYCSGLFRM